MSKNEEKPFYGFVALRGFVLTAGIFFIIGFIVALFYSILLGFLLTLPGLYAIFSYTTTLYFVNPTKTLDQSDVLKLKGNELVLDCGCGLGRATVGIAKQLTTGKVIGTDIWDTVEIPGNSPERAYKNAEIEGVKDKVEFRNGDAFNLPFDDEYFDVVACAGLITSFHNDELKLKVMKELYRVLKSKGTFVMREPIKHLKTLIFLSPTIFFMRLPSKNQWQSLLEKTGFKNIEYFPHRVAGSFRMKKV